MSTAPTSKVDNAPLRFDTREKTPRLARFTKEVVEKQDLGDAEIAFNNAYAEQATCFHQHSTTHGVVRAKAKRTVFALRTKKILANSPHYTNMLQST